MSDTQTPYSPAVARNPNRPSLSLGPLTGEPEYITNICRKLVDTFSAMCKKELTLINSEFGCTDCETFIKSPIESEEGYLVTEHEVSHVLFGTNLLLAGFFFEKMTETMLQRAGIRSKSVEASPYKDKLGEIIHGIWNILEDHRVCSLWTSLYPGGGEYLREYWNILAEYELEDKADSNIMVYLCRKAAGFETDSAPAHYKAAGKVILKYAKLVEMTDAPSTLALTGRCIDEMCDEILKSYPPEKSKSIKINKVGKAGQNYKKIVILCKEYKSGDSKEQTNFQGSHDIDSPENGKAPSGKEKRMVNRILRASGARVDGGATGGESGMKNSDLDRLLKEGKERMKQQIDTAKRLIFQNNKKDKDTDVPQDCAKLCGIPSFVVKPGGKLPKPTNAASALRAELYKLKMNKKLKMSTEGDELDVEALIEAQLNGDDLSEAKIFREYKYTFGLDILLLLDMSGSMSGRGVDMLEAATADIVESIADIPEISLKMWGYSNDLYIYDGIGSPKGVPMWGTNMVQALDSAAEWAMRDKRQRAIIHVTDGAPGSCRYRRSTGSPNGDVAQISKELQSKNIFLSTLVISYWNGSGTTDYFNNIFGKNKCAVLSSYDEMRHELPKLAKIIVESHLSA